jgi:hypothetical protein
MWARPTQRYRYTFAIVKAIRRQANDSAVRRRREMDTLAWVITDGRGWPITLKVVSKSWIEYCAIKMKSHPSSALPTTPPTW